MTVSSTTVRQLYSGNGATVTFAIPFDFEDEDEVTVILRSSAGVETTQTGGGDDYTISGSNVVMDVAPASGEKLLVIRTSDFLQDVDLEASGTYFAEDLEEAMDKVTRLAQELREVLSRVPTLKRTTSDLNLEFPEPEENTLLAANEDGDLVFLSPQDALELPVRERRVGNATCSSSATTKTVSFASAMPDANYRVACSWVNSVDSDPMLQPFLITAKTTSGFTVRWSAPLDSANYSLDYRAEEDT